MVRGPVGTPSGAGERGSRVRMRRWTSEERGSIRSVGARRRPMT